MLPTQKPVVRGYQHGIVSDGRRRDESIRRIGVKAVEFAGENGNFAGQW